MPARCDAVAFDVLETLLDLDGHQTEAELLLYRRQREADEQDLGGIRRPGHPAHTQQSSLEQAVTDLVDRLLDVISRW